LRDPRRLAATFLSLQNSPALTQPVAQRASNTRSRGDEPLHPNWCRLPVAYHGRASSILPSGTAVRRPWGQTAPPDPASPPGFAPSAKIDFELEMGAFVGPGNALGDPIPVENALDHVFGLVLLNDWSARDVQAWEYVPLGPFLSKSWATTISPWVVTLEALAPWAVPAPAQAPPPLPYLAPRPGAAFSNYSVQLEAAIRPAGGGGGSTVSGAGSGGAGSVSAPGGSGNAESGLSSSPPPTVVARSGLASLYWALPQLVAHHAAGGCNLRPGDLLGTGTLSRGGAGGRGCLLEATKGGAAPLQLAAEGGAGFVERTYLEDGDEVVLTGWCAGDGFRVGFGECGGRLLPARSPPA
jgi:fumarylacetoacetase